MDVRYIKGDFPPEKIKEVIHHSVLAVAGRVPDKYQIGLKFWSAVAHSLFDSIFTAFLIKSRHEVDELGQSWKDLDPKTKAYSRPDARQYFPTYDNRAVRHPKLRVRPTLPPDINRQWAGRWYGLFLHLDSREIAGKSTWNYFKAKGYPTLLGLTKNLKLPLLNKTGKLQRSLFPAPLSGGFYLPLDRDQIFQVKPGVLRMGVRHQGIEAIDKDRPLWPENIGPWKSKALEAGRNAIHEAIPEILLRNAN